MDGNQCAQIIQEVFQLLSNVTVNSDAISSGQRLLSALTVLLVAWTGIQMMLEFEPLPSAMAKIIHTLLIAGFASWLIGTAGSGGLFGELKTGLDQIARATAPQGTSGKQFEVLGKMVETATTIWLGKKTEGAQSSGSQPQPASGSDTGSQGGWLSSFGESTVGFIFFKIASFLTRWFVGCFVLIAGLLYFGAIIVAQVQFQIAAVMMPFMVPWIVLEQTSFIFNGWLKFTITAGLQVIVANIIFGLTTGITDKVATMVSTNVNNAATEYMAYASALVITGIMAMVMMQVSAIANGLMSGSANGRWSPAGKLSPAGGIGAASSTTSNVGKAAASGGNRALGGVAGFSTAEKGQRMAGASAGVQQGLASQIRSVIGNKSSTAATKSAASAPRAGGPAASAGSVSSKLANVRKP